MPRVGTYPLGPVFLPAVLAMTVMMVIQSAMPMSKIWQGLAAQFGISWVVLTVSFNVIVTALIIFQLLFFHRTVRSVLTDEQRSTYTGTTTILVESASGKNKYRCSPSDGYILLHSHCSDM
ncbi:hypothetical protein DEU56DRAFT_188713 [Suillus clintonianus]|uniref:uncharacterized protein n=1 Tax=Suillus clintonianus TaxID=1904413 RepID=UPI001B868B7A|nr:uncharacterized protein DEU56DRAFT_188713 [Suillus clintonianus]KAG2114533.1 hypothetical protein DEU56DRAFT_188713 [Suillus clintonianus]